MLDAPLEPVIGRRFAPIRWRSMTARVTTQHSRGTLRARVMHRLGPSQKEGTGNAGARTHPQPRVQIKKHTSYSPQVRRNIRHSLHDGVTAYTRSPRCTGLVVTVVRRFVTRQLDPSVGRSGPHDFAARLGRARLALPKSVHRIPRPTSVTIAIRPSQRGGTAGISNAASSKRRSEIFLRKGLDTGSAQRTLICPSGKSTRKASLLAGLSSSNRLVAQYFETTGGAP
jgi:hypothetical protein